MYKVGIFLYILSKEVLFNFNYMNGKNYHSKINNNKAKHFFPMKRLWTNDYIGHTLLLEYVRQWSFAHNIQPS